MPKPRFLLASAGVECVTFSVAYALCEAGAEVDILPMPGSLEHEVNRWYLEERIRRLPGVSIRSVPQSRYSRVIYEAAHQRPDAKMFRAILESADAVTIVLSGFAGVGWRRWKASAGFLWRHREIIWKKPLFIWNAEIPQAWDATALFGSRTVLGVDVHANFLTDPQLYSVMFKLSWHADSLRPYPVNYVGSGKPEARRKVLEDVYGLLQKCGIAPDTNPFPDSGRSPWLVDNNLAADAYCEVLNRSDFTLCPAGFVLWTHRVVEALCRGSIPILPKETVSFYGLPLIHNIHCWLIEGNDWVGAVRAAMTTTVEQRVAMRKNIAALSSEYLSASAAASAMRKRLGVL